MIADQLKKSILQDAVSGRMTEQFPADEDARELFAKIQEEKARLIAAGELKKAKPLPPLSADEVPFEIPANWVWTRLGDLCSQITDGVHRTPNYVMQGVPFLTIQNISKGHFDPAGMKFVSMEEHAEFTKRCKPEWGDILFCRIGTLGRPYKIVLDFDFSIFVSLALIKPIDRRISDFLVHYISSPSVDSWIEKNKVGGGTHTNKVNLGTLATMPVPLPPLEEHKRILARVEQLHPQIDLLACDEHELNSLREQFPADMRNSILHDAISGGITKQLPADGDAQEILAKIEEEKARLIAAGELKKTKLLPPISEDEIPFEIPANWAWVRLGEVTDYGRAAQVSPDFISLGDWVLELEDIEKIQLRLIGKNRSRKPKSVKRKFRRGDVLYGKLRPYLKKAVVADEDGFSSTEIMPFRGYGGISPFYLMYCMIAPSTDFKINGLTYGMGMPRLGTKEAINLLIPLPPLPEQERIVGRLEELLPLCEGLE